MELWVPGEEVWDAWIMERLFDCTFVHSSLLLVQVTCLHSFGSVWVCSCFSRSVIDRIGADVTSPNIYVLMLDGAVFVVCWWPQHRRCGLQNANTKPMCLLSRQKNMFGNCSFTMLTEQSAYSHRISHGDQSNTPQSLDNTPCHSPHII